MWYLQMLLETGAKRTSEDTFIEFLINIKELCEKGMISEEQKQKKVKEFADKMYGSI